MRHATLARSLVIFACIVSPTLVRADPDDDVPLVPGPTLPLSFEETEDFAPACATECIAAASSGELLCLNQRYQTNCGVGECSAAWVGKGKGELVWKPLVECTGRNSTVKDGNVKALNTKAKKLAVTPVKPLFTYGPFSSLENTIVEKHGDVTFSLTARALTLTRGGSVLDSVPWQPAESTLRASAEEAVTISVYASGDAFLAVMDYDSEGYDYFANRWVMLGVPRDASLDPTPLAPDPALADHCPAPTGKASGKQNPNGDICPAGYEVIAPYLDKMCAHTITSGELASLEAATFGYAPNGVSFGGLAVLFNLHGAMYGYAFKVETWLNDFFYGSATNGKTDWLPASCKTAIRAYKDAKSVPAADAKVRDVVKALYERAKPKK